MWAQGLCAAIIVVELNLVGGLVGKSNVPNFYGLYAKEELLRLRGGAEAGVQAEPKTHMASPANEDAIQRVISQECYYEVMGVAKGCSEDDLKKAYRFGRPVARISPSCDLPLEMWLVPG